jgi:hypothetical protein
MMTDTIDSTTPRAATSPRTEVWRGFAMGVLGSAAFGAAAAVGHGTQLVVKGAWMAPVLFVGGALLAMPPQYLVSALAGGRATPGDVLSTTSKALGAVATVLLGLAAPAAFFSATLHTLTGSVLLLLALVALGSTGVVAMTVQRAARETKAAAQLGALAWCVFALALGGRLMVALGRAVGWF